MEKVFVSQEHFEQIIREQKPATLHRYELPSSITMNQDDYEEWFVPESNDKIYLVSKQKLDFTTFDYLLDMVGFMDDVKYMFDNFNNPNKYSFSKVELSLYTMFVKGLLMPEEVKNQLGETFSAFIPVLVKSYSIMKGEHCNLEDLFKTFDGDHVLVKDILPILANVLKDKITRPQFKLDKEKMNTLSNSIEFDKVKNWLSPFICSLDTNENNIIVDKDALILLLAHITLSMGIDFECSEKTKTVFTDLLKKYREVFDIDRNNMNDISELSNKLSMTAANYNGRCSYEVSNTTHLVDYSKVFSGWYESGYILGSPEGQKLF